MRLIRGILQIILVALVVYFGYFYFTREELRSCVSIPVTALSGKAEKIHLDQGKVEEFLEKLGRSVTDVASKGGELWEQVSEATATKEGALSEQLLDRGQYLYCKSVVEQVEK